MKLEELMASVGSSVQQAQAALEQAGVQQYLSYFQPVQKEGPVQAALRPQTLSFVLPGKEDSSPVEVPVLALCGHSAMAFDQVNIRLNVTLEAPEDGTALEAIPTAPNQGGHQIDLTFRRSEPAEVISRFQDAAGQLI